MVPATFHFPGQEHQQTAEKLTTVATGTHPAPTPAKPPPSPADQQRRIFALQIAQKQGPQLKLDALIEAAASLEQYIRTGAKPGDVVAHGATAVKS